MDVRVFGALTLDDGRIQPTPRDRVVMAALTACLGEPVSISSLASALWGENPPESWRRIIPGCIMRLRRLIAPAEIETAPLGYRLRPEHVEVDAGRFDRLVSRGTQLLELGEPERAAHALSEALALWRGEPYPELEEWGPAQITSDLLQERRLGAEELLLDARLRAGESHEVTALARARVAEAPLRERRWVLLGVAQYRQGRQADALATVRRARGLLAAELGLDPGAELAELELAILRQDPSLMSVGQARAASPRCPYFGLLPAGVSDADRFFGREPELSRALTALEERGLLIVAGSSGVGKSSFVRAGIGADFVSRGQPVIVVTPGEHPLESIRDVAPGTGSLLIVDQCEQALLADDRGEIDAFFAWLSSMVYRGPLVIAIRVDRLGDLADHGGFASLIGSHLLLLGALDREGLRAITEKPAHQAGLILEPGLVEIILRDADGRGLPLLSHVLRQVWSRREGRVLTVDGYREAGEIDGAVAKTAEEVLESLPPGGERLLRDVLLRLVDSSDDGLATPRRVSRAVVTIEDAHAEVVDRLIEARLLTADERCVQLSHEALVRAWPRLRQWLAEDLDGQRIVRHLGVSASAWDAMDRPDSELYRGSRLDAARRWQHAAHPALTALEHQFLDASAANEAAGRAAAQDRLRHERRMAHRLSWMSAGAAVLAVGVVVVAIAATTQADIAVQRDRVLESGRVAALALDEPEFDRALLFALQAIQLSDGPEARKNLLSVISRAPDVTSVTRMAGGAVPVDLVLAEDGALASVIDSEHRLHLIDLDARSEVGQYAPPGTRVLASDFHPRAEEVTVSQAGEACAEGARCAARTATIGLPGGGRRGLTDFVGLDLAGADIEYSPDGSLFAAVTAPRFADSRWTQIGLWKTDASGTSAPMVLQLELAGHASPFSGRVVVRFSPDGSRLYGSGFGDTVVFDTATGAELSRIPGAGLLAVSADGVRIAVRHSTNAVRLIDVAGNAAPITVRLSGSAITAGFSPDGSQLAVATGTGIDVASTSTGDVTEHLSAHDGTVTAVAYRPSGELVTAASDGAILTWDGDDWSSKFRVSDYSPGVLFRGSDERRVMLERPDGSTRTIVADPGDWENRACEVAGRVLTEAEWSAVFGARAYAPACGD